MAKLIAVDTSVLISYLRGDKSPAVQYFERLESERAPYAIPIICIQEVLQGARDKREWALLEKYLCSQDILYPQDPHHTHLEAARIFIDCRRKGVTPRSSVDCIIAQLCLDEKAALLHDDLDFRTIQKVRPLNLLP